MLKDSTQQTLECENRGDPGGSIEAVGLKGGTWGEKDGIRKVRKMRRIALCLLGRIGDKKSQ